MIDILELFDLKHDNVLNKWLCKVRIVARGDRFEANASRKSVYSPVASSVALRLFLCLAGNFETSVLQFDVSTAFLYGRSSKTLYFRLPYGHKARKKGGRNMVWRGNASLYGLKSAPQVWNSTFTLKLRDYGFRSLYSDVCFFFKSFTDSVFDSSIIMILYVDDALFCGKKEAVQEFIIFLQKSFQIKVKEQAETFIGLHLINDDGNIYVNQEPYIVEAAQRFQVDEAKPVDVPMLPGYLDIGKDGNLGSPRALD